MPTFTEITQEAERVAKLTGRPLEEVYMALSLLEQGNLVTNGHAYSPINKSLSNKVSYREIFNEADFVEAQSFLAGKTIFEYIDYCREKNGIGSEVNSALWCDITRRDRPTTTREWRALNDTFRLASGLEIIRGSTGMQSVTNGPDKQPRFKITSTDPTTQLETKPSSSYSRPIQIGKK